MKTLVIHPNDESTTFLSKIYENIPNKTVITGGCSKKHIKTIIPDYDRVIMLGHGSPFGLFSMGNFDSMNNSYIIDSTMVYELQNTKENIFIWCNADIFVNYFRLKGFYSGMFISEVIEADYCGLLSTSQDDVDNSNYAFVDSLSTHINNNVTDIYTNVLNEYNVIAEQNLVAEYNRNRLYLKL